MKSVAKKLIVPQCYRLMQEVYYFSKTVYDRRLAGKYGGRRPPASESRITNWNFIAIFQVKIVRLVMYNLLYARLVRQNDRQSTNR